MAITLSKTQGAELPDDALTLRDSAGAVIDFSSGWTFVLKVGTLGNAADLTKSTGFTGAAVAPNLTIAWAAAAELNTLPAGPCYSLLLIATRTSDSKQRIFPGSLTLNQPIT